MIGSRPLRALLAAETVSSFGSNMTIVALPWFVLTTTGSASKMGLVFAVQLLPLALFGFASGLVVQRLGGRTTMVVADATRAPLVALVPFLYLLGVLSFPVLLVIVFALGVFGTPYYASQRLILPEILGDDERGVAQANSLVEGANELTFLIGPALAGVLIALLGPANVLWIDAASYLVALVLVVGFIPRRAKAAAEEPVRGVFAGLRYLKRDPLLGRIAIASLIFGFAGPMLIAALPYLAFTRYDQDPKIAGWLLASLGAGAAAGSVLTYRLLRNVQPLRVSSFGVIGIASLLWVLAIPMPAWGVAAVLVAIGLANPLTNAVVALFTVRVPALFRATVMTSLITINGLTAPIGYLVAGAVLESVGFVGVIVLMAAVDTLAAALFLSASIRRAHQAGESATESPPGPSPATTVGPGGPRPAP